MEIFLILMIPLMGTTLGSLMVFLMRDKVRVGTEKLLLGFASGVMIAASVWSLLIPSMELSEQGYGKMNWVPPVVGFAAGILFLLGIDSFVPHLHLDSDKPEGMRSGLSKTTMMLLAVTIHNVPEGMAVGAAVAGSTGTGGDSVTLASTFALALGIAIQNFPEGAVVSMPLKSEGMKKGKSVCDGSAVGSCRADRCGGDDTARFIHRSAFAVYAVVCGRGYDVCCDRRAYTRGTGQRA